MSSLVLLAHGAGAPSTSAWMTGWAERLRALGPVETFDYPYMAAGKKRPDRQPVLVEAHRAALDAARERHPGVDRVVLAGKSLGGRMGCHLSLEVEVDALVCLGYPLVSMFKDKQGNRPMRDQVLRDLRTPVLFVQGTRDSLCPLDTLAAVRAEMAAPSELHVVETGDHSLVITKTHTKKTGVTQDDADQAAFEAIRAFLADR